MRTGRVRAECGRRDALLWVVLAAALLLGGCTYSRQEPGLFRPRPSDPVSMVSVGPENLPPEPTNRQLPVLGEQIWTTADELPITVRFAVHAVRRVPGATVLDWSVTPLPSAGLRTGDRTPRSIDLGLDRDDNGDQRIYLVDSAGRVYRPLAHKGDEDFHHCLCTPLWVAQLDLRIGETRLLQLALAPLPAGVDQVDVVLANSIPFWHVPVTADGMVPLAARSVDLTRPPERTAAVSSVLPFTESDRPLGRRRSIELLRVESGPSGTALSWQIGSRQDQVFPAFSFGSPPVAASFGATPRLRTTNVASGPVLRVGSRSAVLHARWITSDQPAPGYRECLCSHFGLWAAGLRNAGGVATVVTVYPPLPTGTRHVEVELPGLTTVDVPVAPPGLDPDRAMLGVGRVIVPTWTYDTANPPAGWQTSDWPTPLPDPAQLRDYMASVDRLVDQPHTG
ncbi:hypothetical protein [Microlunatus ginsengisoli]|uniref:Lipoprotein n=1 Tax=Microlunatus ginsengisoli TaxID=363863 RepID=A0ABP7AWJ3_9ACTN